MSTETERAAIAWKHVREALANGCSDAEVGHIARTRFAVGAHLVPEAASLSDAARAVIAGCVADSADIEAEPVAVPAVWDEIRAAFPLSLYAAVWSSEVDVDYVAEAGAMSTSDGLGSSTTEGKTMDDLDSAEQQDRDEQLRKFGHPPDADPPTSASADVVPSTYDEQAADEGIAKLGD